MILAIKTAGPVTELWLSAKPTAAFTAKPQLQWESGRQLAAEFLGRLTGLLAAHHVALTSLTGVIIFSGPGSFTSLRIGHTVANALADSLGIPVAGAHNTPADAPDNGWLDAGRAALATAQPGRPALPDYGSEAHITRPKS